MALWKQPLRHRAQSPSCSPILGLPALPEAPAAQAAGCGVLFRGGEEMCPPCKCPQPGQARTDNSRQSTWANGLGQWWRVSRVPGRCEEGRLGPPALYFHCTQGLALTHVLQENLKPTAGPRPEAAKVVILVTDGKSQDDVHSAGRVLKDLNVDVFAVGEQPGPPPGGLLAQAGVCAPSSSWAGGLEASLSLSAPSL